MPLFKQIGLTDMVADPEVIAHIRVVVVENDLLTRVRLTTNILRSKDITVVGETCNNNDLLQMADDLLPDVVIIDVGTSDSSEVARKIHSKHADIGIMMLTLHQGEHDIFASLAAGVTGYAMKDTGPEHLHTAIRSVYAGDTWIDAKNAANLLRKQEQKLPIVESSLDLLRSTIFTTRTEQKRLEPIPEVDTREIEPEPLSPRELQVVNLIVDGLSNRDIAEKLVVSLATAKSHVRSVLNKFAVTNRTQAAISAMKQGIVYAKPPGSLALASSEALARTS